MRSEQNAAECAKSRTNRWGSFKDATNQTKWPQFSGPPCTYKIH